MPRRLGAHALEDLFGGGTWGSALDQLLRQLRIPIEDVPSPLARQLGHHLDRLLLKPLFRAMTAAAARLQVVAVRLDSRPQHVDSLLLGGGGGDDHLLPVPYARGALDLPPRGSATQTEHRPEVHQDALVAIEVGLVDDE